MQKANTNNDTPVVADMVCVVDIKMQLTDTSYHKRQLKHVASSPIVKSFHFRFHVCCDKSSTGNALQAILQTGKVYKPTVQFIISSIYYC